MMKKNDENSLKDRLNEEPAEEKTTVSESNAAAPSESEESQDNIIICDNLVKIYKTEDVEVLALQGLDILIGRGELMAIIGNSGSGKSTFLNMIGGLDRPSAGRLIVDGKDLFKMNERELVDYKRNTVGFVWQNNARNLLPYLTAAENVQMPMLFTNSDQKKRAKALELLEMVGLSHRKDSKLSQSRSHWQIRRRSCWRMSRRDRSTSKPAPTSSMFSRKSTKTPDSRSSSSHMTGCSVRKCTASPRSGTARSVRR